MSHDDVRGMLDTNELSPRFSNDEDEVMEKVVRDGKVAVLVSPGYGAGWYTWNEKHQECLYDPDVVSWVEGGKVGKCPDLEGKYGWDYFYAGGAHQLEVVWLPLNTLFQIHEYDGKEWVETAENQKWLKA